MLRGFGFPTVGAARPAAPSAPAMEGSQFTQALRQPEVQAALMQFGINMLTPSSAGFGGQLGRSLGAAGAAAGRASGQKQAAEARKRAEEMEERRFGLDERKVKVGEREVTRKEKGGSLQNMFSKPVPLSKFLSDQAIAKSESTYGETSPDAYLNDPAWRTQMTQTWQQINGLGSGTQASMKSQTGASTPDQGGGGLLEEARLAIQQRAPRDEVIKILLQRGIDPTGL